MEFAVKLKNKVQGKEFIADPAFQGNPARSITKSKIQGIPFELLQDYFPGINELISEREYIITGSLLTDWIIYKELKDHSDMTLFLLANNPNGIGEDFRIKDVKESRYWKNIRKESLRAGNEHIISYNLTNESSGKTLSLSTNFNSEAVFLLIDQNLITAHKLFQYSKEEDFVCETCPGASIDCANHLIRFDPNQRSSLLLQLLYLPKNKSKVELLLENGWRWYSKRDSVLFDRASKRRQEKKPAAIKKMPVLKESLNDYCCSWTVSTDAITIAVDRTDSQQGVYDHKIHHVITPVPIPIDPFDEVLEDDVPYPRQPEDFMEYTLGLKTPKKKKFKQAEPSKELKSLLSEESLFDHMQKKLSARYSKFKAVDPEGVIGTKATDNSTE